MAEIRRKAIFFDLWERGLLGNKLRTWRRVSDAATSGVMPVGFREIGKAGGGAFAIVTNAIDLVDVALDWERAGRTFMICEAAPDGLGIIQGEVMRGLYGWEGTIGPVVDGRRMRDSIRDGHLQPVRGAQVTNLLRYMDASSRDDLDALLDLYPDAVVEFTVYGVDVGTLPGRNTIFWEVRSY